MEMNEKILLLVFGNEIDNLDLYLINLMIIFAGYVIHRT